jgi:hypothetical protein
MKAHFRTKPAIMTKRTTTITKAQIMKLLPGTIRVMAMIVGIVPTLGEKIMNPA